MNRAMDDGLTWVRPLRFEDFYTKSWIEVFRPLAACLGDTDLAREATDEAMCRAFASWSKVSGLSNIEGWVYRVAYRWAIDRLRRRQTERRLLPRLTHGRDVVDVVEVEPGLVPALASLSLEQRTVVVLACVYDWSEAQIAEAVGVRPGTVKSRLHRGLSKLRQEMST